ncbi:MAG: adenine phosphoribosyltransferase [Armatimonadetes bacterium]|nr:adenine phosphoribosyltransferase [Armatimonadota bacterium]
MKARQLIREIHDFPTPGILFRDITPVLLDPEALRECIDLYVEDAEARQAELIIGIESRGFLFGIPVADRLGLGFAPVRKLGKLPYSTLQAEYDLEYGSNTVEMHVDAIQPGQRCVIIDDLLATGGTAEAACGLVEQLGGVVAGITCLIELTFLNGRSRLSGYPITSFIQY